MTRNACGLSSETPQHPGPGLERSFDLASSIDPQTSELTYTERRLRDIALAVATIRAWTLVFGASLTLLMITMLIIVAAQ
jgi:hypothetical protein